MPSAVVSERVIQDHDGRGWTIKCNLNKRGLTIFRFSLIIRSTLSDLMLSSYVLILVRTLTSSRFASAIRFVIPVLVGALVNGYIGLWTVLSHVSSRAERQTRCLCEYTKKSTLSIGWRWWSVVISVHWSTGLLFCKILLLTSTLTVPDVRFNLVRAYQTRSISEMRSPSNAV